MRLSFVAYGDPKPQGSKRAYVTKQGKAVLVESAGKPLKDWRQDVVVYALQAIRESDWHQTDEPIACRLEFTLRPPKRPRFPYPATRPDLDKLVRSVLDSLTVAGVWLDDSQVIDLHVAKRYGERSGVGVAVWLA